MCLWLLAVPVSAVAVLVVWCTYLDARLCSVVSVGVRLDNMFEMWMSYFCGVFSRSNYEYIPVVRLWWMVCWSAVRWSFLKEQSTCGTKGSYSAVLSRGDVRSVVLWWYVQYYVVKYAYDQACVNERHEHLMKRKRTTLMNYQNGSGIAEARANMRRSSSRSRIFKTRPYRWFQFQYDVQRMLRNKDFKCVWIHCNSSWVSCAFVKLLLHG